ncbi:hypothetical protein BJD99_11120 [Rhodococcus sp. 1163]|nr:hypothetical protein BJD99_11120 [Rhodococcus sp. 1163]
MCIQVGGGELIDFRLLRTTVMISSTTPSRSDITVAPEYRSTSHPSSTKMFWRRRSLVNVAGSM